MPRKKPLLDKVGLVTLALLAPIVVAGSPQPAGAQPVATPNFWDQGAITQTPSLTPERTRLRFLTSVDYPPFNFLDARGRLAGFNVELARAICEELGILDICQIEAMPFQELVPALLRGEGDAVIAGVAVSAESREQLAFTGAYFRYPARFVTLTGTELDEGIATGLRTRAIGVVEGTAHEAMLRSFFPDARATPFADRQAMLDAMREGAVEAAFGDGVGLSFWLASENADGCCRFAGGPYLSDAFLGEGLAVGVRREDAALAEALDGALARIVGERRFSELLLRYFPVSAF